MLKFFRSDSTLRFPELYCVTCQWYLSVDEIAASYIEFAARKYLIIRLEYSFGNLSVESDLKNFNKLKL